MAECITINNNNIWSIMYFNNVFQLLIAFRGHSLGYKLGQLI